MMTEGKKKLLVDKTASGHLHRRSTMRASYLTAYGGNEVVSSGELPAPVLSEGTSLIEIKAAGVNPVELGMRAGGFQRVLPYTFPQVPGFDISGVVREVSGSSRFKVGDE